MRLVIGEVNSPCGIPHFIGCLDVGYLDFPRSYALRLQFANFAEDRVVAGVFHDRTSKKRPQGLPYYPCGLVYELPYGRPYRNERLTNTAKISCSFCIGL